jgi:hypothetical protein
VAEDQAKDLHTEDLTKLVEVDNGFDKLQGQRGRGEVNPQFPFESLELDDR